METKNHCCGIVLLVAFLLLSSCCARKDTAFSNPADSFEGRGYVAATVFYPEGMAGCGYLLKSGDRTLQPLNMHDSLHVDGMKVWIRFHAEKQQMSVCMMGDIISLDDIQIRP